MAPWLLLVVVPGRERSITCNCNRIAMGCRNASASSHYLGTVIVVSAREQFLKSFISHPTNIRFDLIQSGSEVMSSFGLASAVVGPNQADHRDYTEIIPIPIDILLRLPLASSGRFLIPVTVRKKCPPGKERYLAAASCQSARVSGTLSSSPFCIPSPPSKCTALSGLPFSPCPKPLLYSAPFCA